MHGGNSKGPKTNAGKERSRAAAFRHGNYTKESIAFQKESMELIRQSKNLLNYFGR